MPNTIDQTGITIQTLPQIIDEILNGTADYPGMFQIYGANINVAPNSPDGQMIAIVAQAKLDMLEFIAQVFASFDPDQAVGVVLDQRCSINGVARQAGTYTVTPVTVTVDRAVTLAGLDTAPTAPFTISDAAGNQYQLVATHAFTVAGSVVLAFQAAVLGAVTPTLNNITNIVTITLGVTGVNNPTAATTIGTNEESDYALRIRRAKSVALPSRGFFEGLWGALLDTTGVTSVNLLENYGGAADGNGVPAHSIWAIVAGGTGADVAQAIYIKRNAGCGMKGGTSVNVTQVDASVCIIKFDRPTPEPLWISFDVAAITGVVDTNAIRRYLLQQLSYQIGQSADASTITSLVKAFAPNAAVSLMGVSSDNVTYAELLAPTAVNYQFSVSSPHIIINASPGA